MFNLQGSEIIVILLLALVVLGPEKLPDAIRRFTRTYHELKKMGSGFQTELKSALEEPVREMRETADLMMNAADPEKVAAEAEAEVAARTQTTDDSVDVDERAFLVNDPAFERTQGGDDAEPARPMNQIAQGNSSASINAAAAARAATAAAAEVAADGDDGDADLGDDDHPAGDDDSAEFDDGIAEEANAS